MVRITRTHTYTYTVFADIEELWAAGTDQVKQATIGGSVSGGLILLVLIGVAIFAYWRRRKALKKVMMMIMMIMMLCISHSFHPLHRKQRARYWSSSASRAPARSNPWTSRLKPLRQRLPRRNSVHHELQRPHEPSLKTLNSRRSSR